MQAYTEGYELLAAEDSIVDVPAVMRAWTDGTVVRSWILDLLVDALIDDPALATISATPKTPARDAGRSRKQSPMPFRSRSSRRHCWPGSPPGRTTPPR